MEGIQNPELSCAMVVSLAQSLRHWQMSLSGLKTSHKQVTKPLTGLGRQRVSQNSSDSPALVRLGKGESFRQAGKGEEVPHHCPATLRFGGVQSQLLHPSFWARPWVVWP